MKLDCQIIEDLLPLYVDGVCSEKSREAVCNHLRQCPNCAKLACPAEELPLLPEAEPEIKTIKRSFRKLRRRWVLSLIILLVAMPVLYMLGRLTYNQYRRQGICFENLGLVWEAEALVEALEDGEFEAFARQLDYSADYNSIRDALDTTLEESYPKVTRILVEGEAYWTFAADDLVEASKMPDFWMVSIYDGWDRILYPKAVFEKVAQEIGAQTDGDGYYFQNGNGFYPVELKWGQYYVNSIYYADIMRFQDSPLDLYHALDLWPEALYLEAEPLIWEETKEEWKLSQQWNAPYAEMTREDYDSFRQNKLVQELSVLTQRGMHVECLGVVDAYYRDSWTVVVELRLDTPDGKVRMTLHISRGEGRLDIGATGIVNGPDPWGNALTDALF